MPRGDFFQWLLLLTICVVLLAASMVIPAGDDELPDPCGQYVSYFGTDERPSYKVNILKDKDGQVEGYWYGSDSGQLLYLGKWQAQKDGTWKESYDAGVRACNPWTWRLMSRKPLEWDDTREQGWNLVKP